MLCYVMLCVYCGVCSDVERVSLTLSPPLSESLNVHIHNDLIFILSLYWYSALLLRYFHNKWSRRYYHLEWNTKVLHHSLTHSLTYLLTHSLTQSLSHLLTYSLTHSLAYLHSSSATDYIAVYCPPDSSGIGDYLDSSFVGMAANGMLC